MLNGEIPLLGDLRENKPSQCVRNLPTILNIPKDNFLEFSEEKRREKETRKSIIKGEL